MPKQKSIAERTRLETTEQYRWGLHSASTAIMNEIDRRIETHKSDGHTSDYAKALGELKSFIHTFIDIKESGEKHENKGDREDSYD